jgi:hypothetical protein
VLALSCRRREIMSGRRYLLAVVLLLLPFTALTAQDKTEAGPDQAAAATITERELRAHMNFLASDELEGRGTGDHSLEVAAKYIESEYAEAGLAPPPGQKDYFQKIPFTIRRLAGTPDFTVVRQAEGKDASKSFKFGEDFTVMSFSGAGEAASEVVFAGYGITAPQQKYDDYDGVDVKGKAVLALRYSPRYGKADEQLVPREHAFLQVKYENALKHGASALILVTGAAHSRDRAPMQTSSYAAGRPGEAAKGIPAFHVSPELAQQILGNRKLEDLESGIEKNLKPASFSVPGAKVSLCVKMEEEDSGIRNVIGFVEGSDPKLKNELVIVGAHYDHLGKTRDQVFCGADDNASGTCSLIEVAEAFTLADRKPLRSVMFIAFAAEEIGLVGSGYYVEHPLVPLADTILMVNMDMVGRAKEDAASIGGGKLCPEIEEICQKSADAAGIKPALSGAPGGGSDHASFFGKGVPALFVISSSNPDYHTPRDTPDKINFSTMTRVAKMVYLIASACASLPERPKVDIEAARRQSGRRFDDRPYLGANFKDTDKGLEVESVSENSPAEKAGLKPGDIIAKLKGQEVKDREGLRGILRELKVGDAVTLEILRSGEKHTLEITLDRRPRRR